METNLFNAARDGLCITCALRPPAQGHSFSANDGRNLDARADVRTEIINRNRRLHHRKGLQSLRKAFIEARLPRILKNRFSSAVLYEEEMVRYDPSENGDEHNLIE